MAPPKGPNKRAKGTGSITQRANGYYVGALRVTDSTGKRTGKYVGGWDYEAVDAKLAALIAGEKLPATLAQLREVKACVWDEGARWAAVECGVVGDESAGWLTAGDNPYR